MKGLAAALLLGLAWIGRCEAAQDFFASSPLDVVDQPGSTPVATTFGPRLSLTMGAITSGRSIVNEERTPANPIPPLTSPIEDLFERKYWYLVLLDTKEVFTTPARWTSRDWLITGGIVAGIGTVAVFDEEIERGIRHARSDTATKIFDNIQPLGNEYAIGIVGTFYLAGEIFKDPRAKATALDSIAATAIASGLIDNSLKYVVGRGRPTDGKGAYDFQPFSGRDSFASGHTTEAFALASVISEHYDEPWIRFTSFSLAGAVGYARLNNNRHWPSDVLAGAAIGTFVGKVVVRFNRKHRSVLIEPVLSSNLKGAQLSMAW